MARHILDDIRPDLIVGAGGFTQVPVMREAEKRGIPCAIHQLDTTPTLSNRLVAARCRSLTTSFEYSSPPFGRNVTTTRIPTPCRFANVSIPDKESGSSYFFLDHTRPIVFVFGGGTGARALNHAMEIVHERLTDVQWIFATGEGRGAGLVVDRRTVVKTFFDERDMLFAYAAADVVVCRAGMGTVSELAALSKPAIIVPIPNSHQEANAEALKEGIVIVRQTEHLHDELRATIEGLLPDRERLAHMGSTLHRLLPTDNGTALAERWLDLINT